MKKNSVIIGLAIFLLSIFLRVYRIDDRHQFGLDEEYQATLAMTIVDDFHPIWIGVSASDTGFYLGPYWTYLTALLLKIGSGDILITAYAAALLGSMTALTIYLLVKRYVGFWAGVIGGVLYSVLPMFVFFDQKYWNPSPIPLVTVLFVYLATNVKNQTNLLLLSLLMALIFHVHLSLLALFVPLGFVVIKNYKSIKRSSIVKAFLIFLFTNIPLIVFDYYKKGSNLKSIIGLSGYKGGVNPSDQAINILRSISRLFYFEPGLEVSEEVLSSCANFVKSSPSAFIGGGILVLMMFWVFKYFKESEFNQVIVVSFSSFLVLTLMFRGVFREYYLLGMFVLLIIGLASLVYRFNKIAVVGLLGLVLFFSLKTIVVAQESYGLKVKKELVSKVIEEFKGKSYRVIEAGSCHKYAGFRYLFKQYGSYPPASSSIDSNLGWLYPDEISSETANFLVTVLATKDLDDSNDDKKLKITSGGFTALIETGM